MLQRLVAVAAVLGALGIVTAAGATGSSTRYYLALGDSLSQGMQPDVHGVTRNTTEGYTDQLFAILSRHIRGLRLVKLGCGGESTGSMITGHGNDRNARLLHCDRAGGSQLAAAVRFLRAHHAAGEVALVTIDIGANDVDGCTGKPASQIFPCVSAGQAAIKHDMPIILSRLRRAAPKGAVLAGMNLYDPVLGDYFSSSSQARALAAASVPLLKQINDIIGSADSHTGFKTADVADAFASYDSTHTVSFGGQQIPLNVARVCSWTWACTTPPSGPNIHANKNGYAVIAQAFAAVLRRLT